MHQTSGDNGAHKKGQRGIRRHLANQGGVMPRIRYKFCGRTILLCVSSGKGKDDVLAVVRDPRSARAICDTINTLRSEIIELKKLIATQ